MSNVIKFPIRVMQQVCETIQQAELYVTEFMGKGDYKTANIVPIDGLYVATVFPHEDLMAEAVRNARKEWVL